ncbi:hypothetical protein AbraIFM66951_004919 [Aspergillus brasiliensis]|uniref:Uncharacterized protein n=1 Tax=Aspergillus brasiliensis TaxID=319629 RepID=A0A9W5YZK4_9EURO|nr:hypothetical protein AbraCBS73388_002500 [Aspergillus brasiliensis]GKZ43553.1 hypothetical protein AbraIFM66951_004919 [Aspergillus brasiliensis]
MGLIKTGIQLAGAYGLLRAGSKAANEYQEKKQSKQESQNNQCSCCHHHQQNPYPQQFSPQQAPLQQVPHHEYGYNSQMYQPRDGPQYASNGQQYVNPGPQYQHPPVHYDGQRPEQQQYQQHPEWR